jgi:glycosyltransferase involved in cell wall biosynthesis
MIAPTPFFADRGCHVRILEEAKTLKSLGNEITICTYHLGKDMPGFKIKRIINIPWYNKLEAGPSYHKLYLDGLLLLKSLSAVNREKPDIIHAHLHEGALLAKVCAWSRFNRIPLVFDIQGSLSREMLSHGFIRGKGLRHRLFHFLENRINKLPNAIIASSNNVAEILKTESDIEEGKVFVVADGVDTDMFRPDCDTATLREKLNIPQSSKVIVYLGLLTEYQGIDYLLKATPLVRKEIAGVHFLIMGYPNVERYRSVAQELGICESITFTGRIDYNEAPKYLALGNIAVSPKVTTSEGNGKIYNYMAAGLPCVAFDTKVNREILGDLGVYAQLGDYKSLAARLLELLMQGNVREELSRKVREKAVADYSWHKVGQRIMDVYAKVGPKERN